MKILFLSDIHLDINSRVIGRDLLPSLIEYINSKKVDMVVIAGDISDYYKTTIRILDKLRSETGIEIVFIPGNHDIWVNNDEKSWTAYQKFKDHQSSLIDRPRVLNDEYVIIGDMGWYDYSFGPETVSHTVLHEKKKKLWKDAFYALWNRSDADMVEYSLHKLLPQLEKYKHKKVIFINHFIPFKDFIVTIESDVNWNLGNAYMGSEKIGELINSFPNIEWVVFGHTHKKFGVIENYKGNNFICNPVGYAHEWEFDTFEEELERSGVIITL